MMTNLEAFQIVLELARQNALTPEEGFQSCDHEILQESVRQNEALRLFTKFVQSME